MICPVFIWIDTNQDYFFHNLAIITQSLNASIRDAAWDVKMAGKGTDNTEEVNNLHYTYDISQMDEKREAVKKAHAKRAYE